MPVQIGAVAVGGASGSLARWAIALLLPVGIWATLVVNLAGCAVIGVMARHRSRRDDLVWLTLVTGGLGGFTTFSMFAVDTYELGASGQTLSAVVYSAATLAFGPFMTRWFNRW